MNDTITKLQYAIEEARRSGALNNDAARAATVALGLEGDEALLACRLVAQGSDPASIELAVHGSISKPIRQAHREGPGRLVDEDRTRWLFLAALSRDESKESTLIERARQFCEAVERATTADQDQVDRAVNEKLAEINALQYRTAIVGGRSMRVYETDLGFAAAYWGGEHCAAVIGVFNNKPYLAVGSNELPLTQHGITVEKTISPTFGIIESPEAVAAATAGV